MKRVNKKHTFEESKKKNHFVRNTIIGLLCFGLAAGAGYGAYTYGPSLPELLGKLKSLRAEGETISPSENNEESKGTSSFTFVGVGDNLIHGAIYYYQEQAAQGYNFDGLYELTNPYSQTADLAYINAETVCAGEEFGLSSYPVFNGPKEILNAVSNAGFDWISLCSNHSMDTGDTGLFAEMNYIHDNLSGLTYTGSHLSEEDSNTPTVIEVNGIKVGLQSYTYGLNGFSLPEGEEWLVNLIDTGEMKRDIEALNEVSDVQIVTMHWGSEYVTDVSQEQADLAKYLNELGVDVIIGSHPHVIETGEIIHGQNQDTLCYYSLGNFLSAQDSPENMIGGMASFTLNYNFDTKEVSWNDVKFIPTVTYFDSMFYNIKTTIISDYTDEMAASHHYPETTRQYVKDYVSSVFGNPEGFEVILE